MTIENNMYENNHEQTQIENLKNLILTSEQYKDHPFTHAEDQGSYVFELESEDKKLVYFGSKHTNDPGDPLFEKIEEKFKETNPEIVYVEGISRVHDEKELMRDELKKMTTEDAKKYGENFFALKLTADAEQNIDFESPEPDFSSELQFLQSGDFSNKDIFTYYMYRDIDQYQRQHKVKDSEECIKYLASYFKRFRQSSSWNEEELNFLENELVSELNVSDEKHYSEQVDPIPWKGQRQTVINEISRASSNFRDRYIFERIAEGLKKYNKIFVVYGSAHAVKQEPALRGLLHQENH